MKRWLRLSHQKSDANSRSNFSISRLFEYQRREMISDEQLETLQAELLEESLPIWILELQSEVLARTQTSILDLTVPFWRESLQPLLEFAPKLLLSR